ncbi:MAG: hypothetical protein EPO27_16180 [Betaproteobacteria bacterium]|nr:MAG: hypothetical protein EPO27_16180 [Betaproteobacteria bacterium]
MLLALWFCVPFVFAAAWYKLTGGAVLRHVATLHFVVYFVAIYAGSYSLFVDNGEKGEVFIWSVMAYPILALAGTVVAQACFRTTGFRLRLGDLRTSAAERQVVYALSALLAVLLLIYVAILGNETPLYVLITQGPIEAQLARYAATKGYKEAFGDVGLIVNLSRVFTDYFALFLLVFEYCRSRRGETSYRRFWLIALALVVATVLFGERYPVVKLIVYFALAIIALRHRRLGVGLVAWLLLLVAVVVPLVGFVHAATNLHVGLADRDLWTLLGWSWDVFAERLFFGQVSGLYHTFALVPDVYDFFWGRTLSNPRDLLPYEQVQLPFLVNDSHAESVPGVQGSDPTVFFGEVYANFGIAGMLASMVAAGFVMQWLNSTVAGRVDRTRSTYFVALHFMAMVYLADFAISFSALYFDYRLYLLMFLLFVPNMLPLRTSPKVQAVHGNAAATELSR